MPGLGSYWNAPEIWELWMRKKIFLLLWKLNKKLLYYVPELQFLKWPESKCRWRTFSILVNCFFKKRVLKLCCLWCRWNLIYSSQDYIKYCTLPTRAWAVAVSDTFCKLPARSTDLLASALLQNHPMGWMCRFKRNRDKRYKAVL